MVVLFLLLVFSINFYSIDARSSPENVQNYEGAILFSYFVESNQWDIEIVMLY